MTPKQFFDWQTSGGTDDVMRLVDVLERADIAWLIEAHSELTDSLPDSVRRVLKASDPST